MKRKGCGCLVFSVLLIASLGAAAYISFSTALQPTPSRPAEFVRFDKPLRITDALKVLESKGVVKSAFTAGLYAKFTGRSGDVRNGTYQVKAGATVEETLASLRKPFRQMVRLPEGWWEARTGKRLESEDVCSADDYRAATANPAAYSDLGFKLPPDSLEGWLFPDTYELPPMTPAEDVVRLQLKTFKRKVLDKLPEGTDIGRVLTVASMVELEAAKDEERARIAGVIENRLKKGQPLEIDATVLYALQEWKNLPRGVVRTVKSPYNTYLNKGLPPGPIGSPGLKSILAALKPEVHGYLYYVARPNRGHYFASAYPDHLQNIRRARAEWRAAETPK